MSDFRENVEADRGLIKKIQLAVPGFRGYRQKEDIRISDSMLRMQIAKGVQAGIVRVLDEARLAAAKALELDSMNEFAGVLGEAKTLEAKIRHAEQGYSGISAAVRIGTEDLNRLYEYDAAMVDSVRETGLLAETVLHSAESGNYAAVQIDLKKVHAGLQALFAVFEKRNEIMIGMGVF
jgi:hypothetical protein